MSKRLLFPTSVIGSLPRPTFVKELIADDSPHSDEEYRRLMGAAIHYSVALQEAAGIDVITDGEWWRKSYIGVIAELAHGFELSRNPADGRPWTVVVDKLAPKQPGFIAREVSFLKKLTNRQIKATLPAPALLGERMWDPVKSAKAYPTREAFVRDCVPILRRELQLLRDEGAALDAMQHVFARWLDLDRDPPEFPSSFLHTMAAEANHLVFRCAPLASP